MERLLTVAETAELLGLRRGDLDLSAGTVKIERAVSQIGARQVIKKPKTAAGIRTVAFPMWLVPEIERHLEAYSELDGDRRVVRRAVGRHPVPGQLP